MKLIKFDFSKYTRTKVPDELISIREKATGFSREEMNFFALDKVHCECAKVIEEDDTKNHDIIYIANAELADAIVRDYDISIPIIENGKIVNRKFLYTQKEKLEEYKKSIKKVKNSDLDKFTTNYHEDYDACRFDCFVTPFYPEIIVKKK